MFLNSSQNSAGPHLNAINKQTGVANPDLQSPSDSNNQPIDSDVKLETGATLARNSSAPPNFGKEYAGIKADWDNENDEVIVEIETESRASSLRRSLSTEMTKPTEKRIFQLTEQENSYEIYEFGNDNHKLSSSYASSRGALRNQVDIGSFPRLANMQATEDDQYFLEMRDQLVNKMKSVWNSMKFGWSVKTMPKFSSEFPIYLLGKVYFPRSSDKMIPDFTGKLYLPNMEAFFRDYSSRLWFTYRSNIPPLPMPASCPLPKSGVVPTVRTSDCGWGCMLRTGQMMIAQALLMHFMGRNWDYLKSQNVASEAYHRQIIRWFGDTPQWTTPFSIHHLIRISNKPPGEWFGPASVCLLFKKALDEAKRIDPQLASLEIYLVEDRVIYKDDLYELAGISPGDDKHNQLGDETKCKSMLILIPMFLGGADGFNSTYRSILQRLFMEEWTVGMIGGRPKHSVYFIGFQNDGVIYMDPHLSQNVVNVNHDDFNLSSYHCLVPKKMPFNRLDPSCALGFYLRTPREIDQFLAKIPTLTNPNSAAKSYPLVEVAEGRKPNYSRWEEEKKLLAVSKSNPPHRKSSNSSGVSHDFVLF